MIEFGDKLVTWDYEDFREYRGETLEPVVSPVTGVTPDELRDAFTSVIPTPEEMADMVRQHEDENADLTSEERTLRWASAAGGATNL